MKYSFLLVFIFYLSNFFSQNQDHFSGELTFKVERVDINDSVKSVQIIYAKDSLIKVVTFNSESGKQELIKHLNFNKSYLLIETPLQNFAVKTNEHLKVDTIKTYVFFKKFGSKKIAGLKVNKMSVKMNLVEDELTFYYYKKIPAKYANCYLDLPGLPVLFYMANENGLYRYTLQEFKKSNPPLQLFMIPKDFKKVSFDEFAEEFSKMYEIKD